MPLIDWLISLNLGFYDWLSGFTYGLLAVSYTMRDIKWLRIITVIACSVDLFIYYNIRPGQPLWVQFLFTIGFIAINAYQLVLIYRESRQVHFAGDEAFLYRTVFNAMTPGEFKRLLGIGRLESADAGSTLLHHGERVAAVSVLVSGSAAIFVERRLLGMVRPGGFVGEMSYVSGQPASADVVVEEPTRVFTLPCAELDRLREAYPDMYIKITGIFGKDIAEKLRSTSQSLHASNASSGTILLPVTEAI